MLVLVILGGLWWVLRLLHRQQGGPHGEPRPWAADSQRPQQGGVLRAVHCGGAGQNLRARPLREVDEAAGLPLGATDCRLHGCRAEKIASLKVEQIYPVKGIWIIDITNGKMANAVRRVPIHDKLLALDLVECRNAIRDAGHAQLSPHLAYGKNGFKKNMCRMFGAHLDSPAVDIKDP